MQLVLMPGNNRPAAPPAPYADEVERLVRGSGGLLLAFRLVAGLCLMGVGRELREVLTLHRSQRLYAAYAMVDAARDPGCPVLLAADPADGYIYALLRS
jgi:hypothetical protein